MAELIAPDGTRHTLFGYTGARTSLAAGATSALDGAYEFKDDGALWWDTAAAFPASAMPSGTYATSARGGAGDTGSTTRMNPVFAGRPSVGSWTLRLTDGFRGAVGTVLDAELHLETVPTPTSWPDAYIANYRTPMTVPAPGVLANDVANLGGPMAAQLVSGPANGQLVLESSGAFTYTPRSGFAGFDTIVYRALTASGPGNPTSVTIAVAPPTTVQPPTDLRASFVSGNQVTLRWTPAPVGPAATDYVIEGGLTPGQVLGALPVSGALPILTAGLPNGAFYVRVHAVSGGQRSGPSNEIRVFVNSPATPSAPADLTGLVNGSALGLAWRNTFGGGAPTEMLIDVTGSTTATLRLPTTETFAFGGVPGGTYTFKTRAANTSGTSVESNAVTLTFPSGCTGAPSPPANVLAYVVGNVVHVVWDPPPSGSAPSSYTLHVSGGFTGTFPLGTRPFSAPAPSGSYGFSLSAVNACGSSAQTSPQTIVVP